MNLKIPKTALSVSGLTSYIQLLLEEDVQLQQIWVLGEVSSVSPHGSGLFFTLQDPDVKATIKGVIWRSQQTKMIALPRKGELILVLGGIRLYPTRGQYQLMVWQCLPAGEGLLALRFQQLRQRLEAEGLFEHQRKRSLPAHPQTIAIVTSPQAAAWGDVQRTLKSLYPGLNVLLSPAQVQGELAPTSIVRAIQRVERDGRAEVVILTRGGGAREDLTCFNDERVVRSISECSIPVITGIGHQRDESLADLVADVCAHTPTAAAAHAVPSLAQLWEDYQARRGIVQQLVNDRLEAEHLRLQQLQLRLHRQSPDRQLQQKVQSLQRLHQRLMLSTRQQLRQAQQHCQLLRQTLTSLDPEAVIRRGYAVVRQENGTIVREANTLNLGETIHLQIAHGQIEAQVTKLQKTV